MNADPEHALPELPSQHAPAIGSGAASQNPDSRVQRGSFRLLRVAGIDVFLHWSWFFFALLRLQPTDSGDASEFVHYQAQYWYALEYVALFVFVLLHEFGHVLACRSVGGVANCIVLWPLGGIALIDPPARPSAQLWSIVAGPLVNVILLAPTMGFWLACRAAGFQETAPDLYQFAVALTWCNGYLLLFNILPIYPLDGGRALQALLWFFMSRARSMLVAAVIGFLTALGVVAVAIVLRSLVWGIMAGFAGLFCLVGIAGARGLLRALAAPRRSEEACPGCAISPPKGNFWVCTRCLTPLDVFETGGVCPTCSTLQTTILCHTCGRAWPYPEWHPKVSTAHPPAVLAEPGLQPTVAQRVVWGTIFATLALALCGLPNVHEQPLGLIVWTVGGAILGAGSAGILIRAYRQNQQLKKLRGTWSLVEMDGRIIADGEKEVRRLILKCPAYEEQTGDRCDVRGSCWTDLLVEPLRLSFTPKTGPDVGKPRPGICRLEDKTLTLCLAYPGHPRPTAFVSQPEIQQVLVYQRTD